MTLQPAVRPIRTTLSGRTVRLTALDANVHCEDLYRSVGGSGHGALWTYLPYGPFHDREHYRADLEQKSRSEDPLYFAILDSHGTAVGHAAYLRITPEHATIEVGSILYAPAFQRTTGATEAMYLMANHAFEDLGYRRYEWKCDALNAPSRAAALRLGFAFEGIFRQHMIVKQRNRDTAWYSIIDCEWPRLKTAFERWLDASNFDRDGRQRKSLAECRAAEREASTQ